MLRPDEIERLVVSLIADEIGRARKRAVDLGVSTAWGPETTIDEDGVGVDSLMRLDVVARLNEFFHLHESGVEDYLLVRRTLGEWVEIVRAGLELKSERLTFRTSGSTGSPKPSTHAIERLLAEVEAIWDRVGPRSRVIAWTPPHHIYGFLFTALAPARFGLPVIDARTRAPSLKGAEPGDLVVATPFLWRRLLRGGPAAPADVVGLTAAGEATPEIWRGAAEAGVKLTEIFGSTETAGIGARSAEGAPFTLLPTWNRPSEEAEAAAEAGGSLLLSTDGRLVAAPDQLDWSDSAPPDRRFRPAGRRDGMLKVAGVNVDPELVRSVLEAHDLVAEAAVRLDGGRGEDARLKAFVVLTRSVAEEAALRELSRHCATELAAAARPAQIRFGAALPRSEIGKLADWS